MTAGRRLRLALAAQGAALALAPPAMAGTALEGDWLIDGKVALEIYPCAGRFCGRIVWLKFTHPPGERFDRDKRNPRPELRARPLCGLTILTGLRAAGDGRWRGGVFYNPQDGGTYSVNVQAGPSHTLAARLFVVAPVFGKTKTITPFTSAERC